MVAADDVTFARPRNIPAGALVAQAQAPGPTTNPFAGLLGKTQGASAQLTPEQKTLIDKINAYLSNTQKLTGRFVQVGLDLGGLGVQSGVDGLRGLGHEDHDAEEDQQADADPELRVGGIKESRHQAAP